MVDLLVVDRGGMNTKRLDISYILASIKDYEKNFFEYKFNKNNTLICNKELSYPFLKYITEKKSINNFSHMTKKRIVVKLNKGTIKEINNRFRLVRLPKSILIISKRKNLSVYLCENEYEFNYGIFNSLRIFPFNKQMHDFKEDLFIHGSSVEKDGKSFIFTGPRHSGKSSIAFYLNCYHNYNLLNDDMSTVRKIKGSYRISSKTGILKLRNNKLTKSMISEDYGYELFYNQYFKINDSPLKRNRLRRIYLLNKSKDGLTKIRRSDLLYTKEISNCKDPSNLKKDMINKDMIRYVELSFNDISPLLKDMEADS